MAYIALSSAIQYSVSDGANSSKVPGITCFIDNIFITGKDDEEHLHRLDLTLKSFKENDLTIKMSKFSTVFSTILGNKRASNFSEFQFTTIVVYHSHKGFQLYMCMITWWFNLQYSFYVFLITQSCSDKLTEPLTTTNVLAHFNPNMPIGLAFDASAVGIGAVIYTTSTQMVARNQLLYASKTLSDSEKNHSQIERKA